MSVETRIEGVQGEHSSDVREVHAHTFNTYSGKNNGLLVLTERFRDFTPTLIPFLHPTLGGAMNQDVTTGGTPELIFDGAGGGWTDTTTSGGEWDLADAGKVVLTHGENGEFATFEDSVAPVSSDSYESLSGKIDLDNYTPGTQDLLIQFSLASIPVGDQLGLNAYIDTGDFSEQSFSIPLADFALASSNIDGFTITVQRSAGHQPHVKFDDFQLEETGTPQTFKVFAAESRSDFHAKRVRFVFVDNVTGAAGQSYNKILGLNELTNGIVVQIVLGGVTSIAVALKNLSDFYTVGANLVGEPRDDGTNTLMVMELEFSEPIILRRGKDEQDYISITISDDLSGLIQFTGVARGVYELGEA